jgi:hypothetical protein
VCSLSLSNGWYREAIAILCYYATGGVKFNIFLLSKGFGDVWYNQYAHNESLFLIIRQNVFCRIDNVSIQFYLTKFIPEKCVKLLTKFRLSVHQLRIEQFRYNGKTR